MLFGCGGWSCLNRGCKALSKEVMEVWLKVRALEGPGIERLMADEKTSLSRNAEFTTRLAPKARTPTLHNSVGFTQSQQQGNINWTRDIREKRMTQNEWARAYMNIIKWESSVRCSVHVQSLWGGPGQWVRPSHQSHQLCLQQAPVHPKTQVDDFPTFQELLYSIS